MTLLTVLPLHKSQQPQSNAAEAEVAANVAAAETEADAVTVEAEPEVATAKIKTLTKAQRLLITLHTNPNHIKEAKGPLLMFQTMPAPVTGQRDAMQLIVVIHLTVVGCT